MKRERVLTLDEIYELGRFSGVRCFRGEVYSGWDPKPSVMRSLRKDAERNIISELTLEAPSEFSGDSSMFQKLVRAQHYDLPTRLLDVSLNPLVALYFACHDQEKKHLADDASVIVFDFPENKIKYADSDAISVVCNLARLSDDEKEEVSRHIKAEKKAKTSAGGIRRKLNSLAPIERLAQFVRMEKPYFKTNINPADFRRYFFVHPPKSNRRIIAQSGAFIVAGLLEYTKPENAASFRMSRIKIPSGDKAEILSQLDKININNRTMFPEIEFTSRYIKEKWNAPTKIPPGDPENEEDIDSLL